MGNFQRDNRSGFSGRSFGRDRGQGGGRSFQRPGLDRPQMFRATCANCGNECEVPFRPTGSKPIFCNNCFDRNAGQEGGARRSFSGRDDRVRTSFADRPMYDAICTNCGNSCKIPFEPKEGREILCSDCFEAKTGSAPRQSSRMSDRGPRRDGGGSIQMDMLNQKLDKIIELLGGNVTPKAESKKKPTKVQITFNKDEIEGHEDEVALPLAEEIVVSDPVVEEVKDVKKASSKKKPSKKKE